MIWGARLAVGLFQKCENASGDSGGEIARSIVCDDAAVGPRQLSPGSLMLAQPLQSFGGVLADAPRRTVLHAASSKRDYVL